MSCHQFDGGNEKDGEKLGTQVKWRNNFVRWHHINDTLIPDLLKFVNIEQVVSWGSSRLGLGCLSRSDEW